MILSIPSEYPEPTTIYHAVIVTAYNEGEDVLIPSIEAVKNTTFPNDHIIVVLAYEARGGETMANIASALAKKYKNTFKDFLLSEHPADLPHEIVGKGPNLTYAGQRLAEYVEKKHLPIENIIVTSLDSDNHMAPKYLDSVAYEFITHPNRQRLSYQPVSIFTNNIWDAPAPSRVIAVSNSFFNVIRIR